MTFFGCERLPDLLEFLTGLGFEFRLDAEDQLEVIYPENLASVAGEVGKLGPAILARLRRKRELARHQFVGGPLDGGLHGRYPGAVVTYHAGRARHAAYYVDRDGVARFAGWATSRLKAVRLAGKMVWELFPDRRTER